MRHLKQLGQILRGGESRPVLRLPPVPDMSNEEFDALTAKFSDVGGHGVLTVLPPDDFDVLGQVVEIAAVMPPGGTVVLRMSDEAAAKADAARLAALGAEHGISILVVTLDTQIEAFPSGQTVRVVTGDAATTLNAFCYRLGVGMGLVEEGKPFTGGDPLALAAQAVAMVGEARYLRDQDSEVHRLTSAYREFRHQVEQILGQALAEELGLPLLSPLCPGSTQGKVDTSGHTADDLVHAAALEIATRRHSAQAWAVSAARACGERDALEELLDAEGYGDAAKECLARIREAAG